MTSYSMETLLPLFLSTLLSLFLASFVFMFIHIKKTKFLSHKNLPPGTMGWPIFGENLEVISLGRKGTPEKFIQNRMDKYSSPVFKTSLFGSPIMFFCGAAANRLIFSNEGTLVQTWWPYGVSKIFQLKPDFSAGAKTTRSILAAFMTPDSLRKYVSIMDSIAKEHLEMYWDLKGEVTVLPLVKKYAFLMASRLLMSVEDHATITKFEGWLNVVSAGAFAIPLDIPGTQYHRALLSANTFRKEFISIIKQRKSELMEQKISSTKDILSAMLSATDGGVNLIEEDEVAIYIFVLLIAGYDATGTTITLLIKCLSEMPEVYSQVFKEQSEIAKSKPRGEMLNWDDIQKMKYTWNVICEVMRLTPPLQGTFRETIKDFTFAGFSIPKGWKLHWNAYSTHMNPDCFPDPKTFDPSRFEGRGPEPYTFVPFGGGPHKCPGMQYAKNEILIFIHNLVMKYTWEKALPDEKIVLNPLPQPEKGLPLLLRPREPTYERT